MRRTKEDFQKYTIQELFNEIISLEGGDMWDGMSSAGQKKETKIAHEVFAEKMREKGIDWD